MRRVSRGPDTEVLRCPSRRRAMKHDDSQRIEKAIDHCRRHVERARSELERRERHGMDAGHARTMMRTFQQLQAEHEAERSRMLQAKDSEQVGGTGSR